MANATDQPEPFNRKIAVGAAVDKENKEQLSRELYFFAKIINHSIKHEDTSLVLFDDNSLPQRWDRKRDS